METLELRFGNKSIISEKVVSGLKQLPNVVSSMDVLVFSTKLRSAVIALISLNSIGYFLSPDLLKELLMKLSPSMVADYGRYIRKIGSSDSNLQILSDFLDKEKGALNENEIACVKSMEECVSCNKSGHNIAKCKIFARELPSKRWSIVNRARLCYSCLRPGHMKKDCQGNMSCKHCKSSNHHELLHEFMIQRSEIQPGNRERIYRTPVLLKIIPITIHGLNTYVSTYALLYEGLTVTLIDRRIAHSVGTKGTRLKDQTAVEIKAEKIDIRLKSSKGEYYI
ncbi:hypothetical protein TSAR_012479 [Trichomalopsis sarcophagae]|uniref:CCHC-type domain-containing protein n=1 Tax=Trichomalopsis sarcophagae TaxID=543379 RepID=A0A232EFE0_9HYME|nr:hypothetical protein TSAR_012479 [Trichomalopsis sarcophagae]